MLATTSDIEDLTGYTADKGDIMRAQAIIEAFAGRPEILIELDSDKVWMKYAIAWQVAYMDSDTKSVYEQANVQSISQNRTFVQIGGNDFVIAPLAAIAIKRLSWNRSTVIRTEPAFGRVVTRAWEVD